ncbi:MAG TPA: type II CAAX endopeptidase family protein [Terriglobales bacterium]|nr:type II CAAX endopeptidase family protein [Terriglobales bacterium]
MDFNPTEEAPVSALVQEPGIPPPLPQESRPLLRKLELLLLLGVTVGPSVLTAIFIYFVYGVATQRPSGVSYIFFGLATAIVHQAGGLALLFYILFRQGRTLRDIGFSFRWLDIPVSIGLLVLSWIASGLSHYYINSVYFLWTGRHLERWNGAAGYLGTHISFIVVVFLFLNAFYEELIVRAYVMSEIIAWKRSALFAGVFSVAIQSLYHLYQGVPNMLSIAALFTIYAIYYAKSRRILPVILAHLCVDAASAAYLFFFHH